MSLYNNDTQAQSVVTEAARLCEASSHILELAKPKKHMEGLYRDAQWPVPITAREAMATERTLDLARPKRLAEGYKSNRSPIWKVGIGPLNAVASHRYKCNKCMISTGTLASLCIGFCLCRKKIN